VNVYIRVDAGDPDLILALAHAERIASGILAEAGVAIQWYVRPPRPDVDDHPVIVDITSRTPRTFYPGALAYAQICGGVHIRVFWDRIKNLENPSLSTSLLAHVMTHEITHILQGVSRHSKTGVMKARWTADDLFQMAFRPLPFESQDIVLIHSGLARRQSPMERVLTARTAR
jgi:hypothetical protein